MAERSKHYDWFQGQQYKKDPKENFKEKAKITWKFTKIFLYFSLFFLSMWGCVQVFTHKISTSPANGITFSNGDENLSPQVHSYTLANNPEGLYLIKSKAAYLSTTKSDEKKAIVNLNRQLKNDLGVSSPTKARKGGNYVIVLKDKNGKYIGDHAGVAFAVKQSGATPAAQQLKTVIYTTAPIDANKSDYYTLGKSFAVLKNAAPNGIKRYSYTTNNEKDAITINDSGRTISFNALEEKYEELKKAGKISPKAELAIHFNVSVFAAIFNYLKEAQQFTTFENSNYKKGQLLTGEAKKAFLKQEQALSFFMGLIFSKSSYKETDDVRFSQNPIGFSLASTWIPITTWGKAWSKDGGTGPFYGVFVYPIAYITNEIINSLPSLAGWETLITIIIIVVTLSLLMFALNFKNTLQQTKMQELAAKKAIIDAKYAPYKGNKQMENRQRQEVAGLYKKEGISPIAQIGSLFLRMPFFLAMWRVIGSIDHIKATSWLGINFATTSWRAWFGNLGQWENGWSYFPLIVIAVGSQLFSTMLPRILTKRRNKDRMNVQQKEAMKKSNRTQKIMMIVTLFFPLITSAGVQVYFIIRSVWTIFEQLLTHQILIKRKKRMISRAIK